MTHEAGLQLDERQRAMLEAMHIKVWLPSSPEIKSIAIKNIAINSIPEPVSAIKDIKLTAPHVPRSVATPKTVETEFPSGLRPEGVAQMSWLELQAAVAQCRACGLCQSRKQSVFGVGQAPVDVASAPRVDWLIVGEAPGEQEDRLGEPFVGQAGKLLDNMLHAIQLERQHNVFIANVLKCRPPSNRNPEPQEIAQCAPYLQRQIELLQPKVILAMGRFAISTLLQTQEPIGKLRGREHHYRTAPNDAASAVDIPVVVTYHPAYLLRNLPEKAKAWADLCLAVQVMQRARNLPT